MAQGKQQPVARKPQPTASSPQPAAASNSPLNERQRPVHAAPSTQQDRGGCLSKRDTSLAAMIPGRHG